MVWDRDDQVCGSQENNNGSDGINNDRNNVIHIFKAKHMYQEEMKAMRRNESKYTQHMKKVTKSTEQTR